MAASKGRSATLLHDQRAAGDSVVPLVDSALNRNEELCILDSQASQMEHFDSTRSLGFAEETVSASPFAWDDGQHEWQQPWAHHDIPGTPWTHGGGQETDEEPDVSATKQQRRL